MCFPPCGHTPYSVNQGNHGVFPHRQVEKYHFANVKRYFPCENKQWMGWGWGWITGVLIKGTYPSQIQAPVLSGSASLLTFEEVWYRNGAFQKKTNASVLSAEAAYRQPIPNLTLQNSHFRLTPRSSQQTRKYYLLREPQLLLGISVESPVRLRQWFLWGATFLALEAFHFSADIPSHLLMKLTL